MKQPTYNYRVLHKLFEKFFGLIAPFISIRPVSDPRVLPKRVLVIKFGGIGEAVLARSLMETLCRRNPSMSFDCLVEDRTFEAMTVGNPGKIFKYSLSTQGFGAALKTLLAIRKQKYDAVLDFEQDSMLTAAFVRATAIPVRVGFAPPSKNSRTRMFTNPVELSESRSMWKGFIGIGRALDPSLSDDLMTVPLPYTSETDASLSEWVRNHVGAEYRGRLVAMHIGVGPSAQYRRWPMDRFVQLATCLSQNDEPITILLTGGNGEQHLIAEFQRRFIGRSIDASSVGRLDRVAALLQRCDLLISCDTGIMHLGAAMGTPTVGLFGPNTPTCWAPVGPRATFVFQSRQRCSPCINSYLHIIPQTCTAAVEGACMRDIEVDDVLQAATAVIHEPWF